MDSLNWVLDHFLNTQTKSSKLKDLLKELSEVTTDEELKLKFKKIY